MSIRFKPCGGILHLLARLGGLQAEAMDVGHVRERREFLQAHRSLRIGLDVAAPDQADFQARRIAVKHRPPFPREALDRPEIRHCHWDRLDRRFKRARKAQQRNVHVKVRQLQPLGDDATTPGIDSISAAIRRRELRRSPLAPVAISMGR